MMCCAHGYDGRGPVWDGKAVRGSCVREWLGVLGGKGEGEWLRIKLESSCSSLMFPCVNHLSDRARLIALVFTQCIFHLPGIREHQKNMTFKMAEVKNVLT